MKIFLTGATGFIGSHVARLLIKEGCTVYALLRPESNTRRIRDILPSLQIFSGDLMESQTLGIELLKIRPDIAIHMAWYAVPADYLNSPQNIPHVQASLNLATQLAAAKCSRMIAGGTCFEYDTSLEYLSESSPTKPQNLYSACKLALYEILQQFSKLTGMSLGWVRFFHPYGPFETKGRLIPSVISSLLKNKPVEVSPGEQVRDFVHVEDVATAIWEVAKSNLSGPVNIGSGKPTTVKEVTAKIGSLLNKTALIRFGARAYSAYEPMFVCANNTKLTQGTSWTPHFDLEEGLKNTIEQWKSDLLSEELQNTQT